MDPKQLLDQEFAIKSEVSWMAGFFDGEGTICIGIKRPRTTFLRVSIGNTSLECLKIFQDYFGGHIIGPTIERPGCRPFYRWALTYAPAEKFCEMMQPHLFLKKSQASLALEYCWYRPTRHRQGHEVSPETIATDNEYRRKMSELNHGSRLREINS